MSYKYFRDTLEWSLMVALILGAGAIAGAQQDTTQPEGRIVQIGPSDKASAIEDTATTAGTAARGLSAVPRSAAEQPQAAQETSYWIGLVGGPLPPALRAHLNVPEGQGVMVRVVAPESPAAEAGLESFDVLVRANETLLKDMKGLADLVQAAGQRQEQVLLEIIRHGQPQTVAVTPTQRPERLAGEGFGFGFGQREPGMAGNMFRHFFSERPGGLREFRQFRPGIVGQEFAMTELPNGVSVSIQKEDNQPVHITVQRGDEVWEVVGDDPESLNRLPDDLRPFVEQMLHSHGTMGLPGPGVIDLPEGMPHPEIMLPDWDAQQKELRESIETLQQQVEELQQRFATPDEPEN